MYSDEKEIWFGVRTRIRIEGFHYCFKSYSNFGEIDDPQFHILRQEYLNSAKKLEDYIESKCNMDYDDVD